MSISTHFLNTLELHGLWPDEAKAVMDRTEALPSSSAMEGRWQDDVSGYPEQLLPVLWMSIKDSAIEHLEETKPQHFALMILKAA